MTNLNARQRKEAQINCTICTGCWAAIPDDVMDAHEKWHAERNAKEKIPS